MSTGESGQSGGPVTLDQLIALNDEMAALVRAGVPLERGLIDAGRELQGRLGAIAGGVGRRLAEGESLPDALAHSGRSMPDLYRSIVEAGLRSGRLASALEGMATVARGYAEARRAVGLALLYPLMVLSLAYVLSLFFLLQIAPRFVAAFESLGLAPFRFLVILARSGDTVAYWGPIVPALLALMAAHWAWSGRSSVLNSGPLDGMVSRVPLLGSMVANFRSANFAELLALLIDHRVPLDEAVRLASGASGDRALRRAAEDFSDRIRRGEGGESGRAAMAGSLPPLLGWMVTSGHRQGGLATGLRHAAASYRRKAEVKAEALRTVLPTLLMLAIGAGAVLIYSLMIFLPMTTLWEGLALPAR